MAFVVGVRMAVGAGVCFGVGSGGGGEEWGMADDDDDDGGEVVEK